MFDVDTFSLLRCRLDRVQEIRRRVKEGGKVVTTCRCGLLRLECQDAPRIVLVCHCSVCRLENLKKTFHRT